jgi:divalent metal cation (Fe/Co/Zn/Cd) transporter
VYSLGTLFVSGIYVQIPCIKEIMTIIIIIIIIQRMWNVKARVIPVIIGATGTISKTIRKYVSSIPGIHEVRELQKTAILGTEHILRKVLT